MGFKVGDTVEVLDPGLAMLRRMGAPTNHHGKVAEVLDDGQTIMVEFPIGDDDPEEHSQVAPYPVNMVRRRKPAGEG